MRQPFLLLYAFIFCLVTSNPAVAQPAFTDVKKSSGKVMDVFNRMEDSVKRQFEKQNLVWPPVEMYVRSFKYDRQLEIWVKGDSKESFKLFKTYKVCMQSGTMGPKRMEGDYQVPEGFYYINEFNPNSNYHLSLGLNYPNSSDRILSDNARPGGSIYIHGNCVSTGCIPLMDVPMEEVFIIASAVKEQASQDFIPVHVFPIRYNVKKSVEYLTNITKDNSTLLAFNNNIKSAFDFFELKKQLPVIMVNQKGEYVFN
ncbi:MAG TPA: L,D-transpeptidase family protein [Ferruginibacter sp.]|nr:L,D-transpeptidase family protein [Ferruginibacter sp.]